MFTLTAAIPGSPVATVAPVTAQAPAPTPAPGASPTPRPTRAPIVPDLPSAAAGPPYPAPITGLRVYDYADVLSPATRLRAAATIAGIEARTGAQVVVYTQVKPESDTAALAADDARALIDQYGVGRKGFDDGLAILFDLDDNKCHGQVQLYAAPGYEASYLTNADRQAIYQDDMLPHLRNACDVAGSLIWRSTRHSPRSMPRPRRNVPTSCSSPARWMPPRASSSPRWCSSGSSAGPAGAGCATAATPSTSTTRRCSCPPHHRA